MRLYGLMRPVARIAQSVEQGIENPRVLGSIPSPGTTSSKPSLKSGGFLLCGLGRFLVRWQLLLSLITSTDVKSAGKRPTSVCTGVLLSRALNKKMKP